MVSEDDACYGCGSINGDYVIDIILPTGETKHSPRVWIYPQTSRGVITFCNNCFEEQNFRQLSPEDVESIHWHFAELFVESQPRRAAEMLEAFLLQWGRVPDVLSPLGRAYIAMGRRVEGLTLLREAATKFPEHHYRLIDAEFLNGG